jgi:CBS domain-containing protein
MASERDIDRGGPMPQLSLETGAGKPAVFNCPFCGAANIQGTDYCINCNSDLRTLDIPPDTWSPAVGPPGEAVRHIAHADALRVAASTPVREVIATLRDAGHGCAIVVADERVVGIFTERDVLNRVTRDRARLLDVPVAEVMTPDPVALGEDESVLVAIHYMGVGGFRHVPLVDDAGRLRGIVSGRDILAYIDGLLGK